MKDINYFLEAEKEYNLTPIPDMVYIDGIGFEFPDEPLQFLRRQPFSSLAEMSKKNDGKNGLNAVEWLMLYCFMGFFSGYFRADKYHNGIPKIVLEMQMILDSTIKKAPICKSKTLYRFLNDFDKKDFQLGDMYVPTHSLTTTTEDWDKDSDKYVITPLSSDKTKAHSLYELYNHGNETQVNFEQGAKFSVVDIKEVNDRKVIYLNEI